MGGRVRSCAGECVTLRLQWAEKGARSRLRSGERGTTRLEEMAGLLSGMSC